MPKGDLGNGPACGERRRAAMENAVRHPTPWDHVRHQLAEPFPKHSIAAIAGAPNLQDRIGHPGPFGFDDPHHAPRPRLVGRVRAHGHDQHPRPNRAAVHRVETMQRHGFGASQGPHDVRQAGARPLHTTSAGSDGDVEGFAAQGVREPPSVVLVALSLEAPAVKANGECDVVRGPKCWVFDLRTGHEHEASLEEALRERFGHLVPEEVEGVEAGGVQLCLKTTALPYLFEGHRSRHNRVYIQTAAKA